jgi:hypothetical protein
MQNWAKTFKPSRAMSATWLKAKVEDDEDLQAEQVLIAGKW